MIGRTVGHYRILERLGGGGMGVVYKAEDVKLGRMVALKFLPPELTRDPEAKSRFLREARAASLLDHSNICTIHEIGETDDEQTFIAMACYDGETLKARIERGPLDVDDALKIAEQIARGLGKAHASGIVHRDIKPANVIVTNDGVAKILDFGLAKLTGATHITQSKTTLGTLAYMAPEQLRGDVVGAQADLWALGVVLFELLTGQRPFRGDYEQAMAYSILNEQPVSLVELKPDAPAELERIVKKLLRKDPLQRYQAAEELLTELEALRAPSSGSGKSLPRASKPREPLRSGARLGPYEIVEPLGSGGMGDVYRARDTRLDRQVAIKVLAPEFSEDAERKQRFQREAKTISSLSHPSICTLFDVGEQEGTDYLVMEYLEGETLADRLTKGALPLSDLLKIGIQIGEALGAAHRQGVIHRDLKLGNVMLTKPGAVKLVDFGLAKDVGAVTVTSRHSGGTPTPDRPLTAEGAIVGTLAYMAPEQVEGREADARSDIFAFGAILYEMATGRRAFEGATKASLIVAILEKEPALLSETRGVNESSVRGIRSLATIEHVVRQCLEKDPEQRWQSALDVARELGWVFEGGLRSGEALSGEAAQRNLRRWKFAFAAACVVAVAISAGVLWFGRSAGRRDALPAAPIPTIKQLTREPGTELTPSISPDGAQFVYESLASGNRDIYLRRVGGESAINLTKDCSAADGAPAFSPDGQSIAFQSDRDGGGIFVMGATGESARRLTTFGNYPDWAPDGKRIVFSFVEPGGGASSIWVVESAGGTPRKIYEGASARFPVWSPSGSRILFQGGAEGTSAGFLLSTIPSSGGPATKIFEFNEASTLAWPEWKQDGVHFTSSLNGEANLWRVAVDESSGARAGPIQPLFLGTESWQPRSTRDGRRMLFTTCHPGSDILRFDLEIGDRVRLSEPRVLFGESSRFFRAIPSPNGLWLVTVFFEKRTQDILIVNTGTGAKLRLTDDELRENSIVWSPDSSKIYFDASGKSRGEIWSIRPDGGARQFEVAAPDGEELFVAGISPDGRWLYTAGGKGLLPQLVDLELEPAQRKPEPLPPLPEGGQLSYAETSEPVSPDGRSIIGFRSLKPGAPPAGLFLFDIRSRGYQKIAELAEPHDCAWLSDSRRILLWTERDLKLLDTSTGAIVSSGSFPERLSYAQVSRDGRSLYAVRYRVECDVWMLDYTAPVTGLGDDEAVK